MSPLNAEEAGEESLFLFGLTADQMGATRGWYNPVLHYDNAPETRAALDLIFSDHFTRNEPGVFEPLWETLLTGGDTYKHLADLKSYVQAQERLGDLHADQDAGARKAVLKVASFRNSRATVQSPNTTEIFGMPITVTMMPVAIALQGHETEVTR